MKQHIFKVDLKSGDREVTLNVVGDLRDVEEQMQKRSWQLDDLVAITMLGCVDD